MAVEKPWVISPASSPHMCRPTTRCPAFSTISFMKAFSFTGEIVKRSGVKLEV